MALLDKFLQITTNFFTRSFHKKRKKRYCIDFLLHTISFFYIYTFIVFAREVSKAAISGLPSTFISSSGSTPSGMVILFSSSFCSCISGCCFRKTQRHRTRNGAMPLCLFWHSFLVSAGYLPNTVFLIIKIC